MNKYIFNFIDIFYFDFFLNYLLKKVCYLADGIIVYLILKIEIIMKV